MPLTVWRREQGRTGTLALAGKHGMIPTGNDTPEPGMSSRLTEADNEFFLGLYRNAVSFYQPKIERRTAVSLGKISVRDFRQFDQDKTCDYEQETSPGFFPLFKRARIKAQLRKWREHLKSTYEERARACMAAYYRSAIYVSFSQDIRYHEEGIALTTIHELSHALWETIEGELLDRPRAGTRADWEKFRLLVEGYATYADQVWFLDLYPACVRNTVNYAPPPRGSVHFQGLQNIRELVKKFGSQILLEIPKRWRSIEIESL